MMQCLGMLWFGPRFSVPDHSGMDMMAVEEAEEFEVSLEITLQVATA